jgi:hypothetical protein
MNSFQYQKMDDLYWQLITDWLEKEQAERIVGELSNHFYERGIEASIFAAKHRHEYYPHTFLVDISFGDEADEAEFIMKENFNG